jgi:DNA-binding MarR family transcriptional regulator
MSSVNDGYPTHVFALIGVAMTRVKQQLVAELVGQATKLRGSHLRLLSMTPRAGIRPTELAARAGMTKQSLGEFVAALEAAGYLRVDPDPADRRARIVSPTAKGIRLQRQVTQALDGVEAGWRAEVGEQQWTAFRAVLKHIAEGRPAEPD